MTQRGQSFPLIYEEIVHNMIRAQGKKSAPRLFLQEFGCIFRRILFFSLLADVQGDVSLLAATGFQSFGVKGGNLGHALVNPLRQLNM